MHAGKEQRGEHRNHMVPIYCIYSYGGTLRWDLDIGHWEELSLNDAGLVDILLLVKRNPAIGGFECVQDQIGRAHV